MQFSTKCYDVLTLRVIFPKVNLLPETFIHFRGKNALIRELQVLKLQDRCILLAKLGRAAKETNKININNKLIDVIRHYFDVEINNIPIEYLRYNNLRRYFSIAEELYAKAPILIPARIFSSDEVEENVVSQDISKSFSDLKIVKETILKKFA